MAGSIKKKEVLFLKQEDLVPRIPCRFPLCLIPFHLDRGMLSLSRARVLVNGEDMFGTGILEDALGL
jgi:hypothetical protein